ncbi:MAG TPA: MraY family glycosyltransferase [Candidatus Dormibacteraeota bacterium]|nr:MraY family glycosyltransferase [Candidatus Dormibacteraeota bacterium]
MHWAPSAGGSLWLIAIATVVAFALALGLTPLVRRLAQRWGMVDVPDTRRVNERPVPRAGGLATMTSFVVVALAAVAVNAATHTIAVPSELGGIGLVALLGGAIAAALLGLADDYLQLRARWQLLGQVGLAAWAIALGIGVDTLNTPFGDTIRLGGVVELAFTTFWIVGMMNAINFIDGLDGLSSGIGLIAAATLGIISLTVTVGQPFIALLCFVLAGALLGFLRWNFHPASVFAGTSGVMFLGYTLALLSILGTAKVAVALLVLGVPIIDTFWIIVRRLSQGGTPFTPDRGHIHHRLLDLGLSHRRAVLAIYGMCLALAALSLGLSGTGQVYAFLGLFVVLGLLLFILTRRSLVAEELSAESYDTPARPVAASEPRPIDGPAGLPPRTRGEHGRG